MSIPSSVYRLPPTLVVRNTVVWYMSLLTACELRPLRFVSCNLKFNLEFDLKSDLKFDLKSDLNFDLQFDLVTINSTVKLISFSTKINETLEKAVCTIFQNYTIFIS